LEIGFRMTAILAHQHDRLLRPKGHRPIVPFGTDHSFTTSYRANAEGEASTLIQAHGLYSALGQDAERRQVAYRELFRHELEPGLVDQIRRATNGNFVLGDERFAREIEAVIGCRAVQGKSGRPRKYAEPASGTLLDG